MRKKIFEILKKIYGYLMFTSFFAGFLPLIPFIVALFVGGEFAEKTSVFLYKEYYPVVITIGSISLIVGLIGMYVAKLEGLSVKKATPPEEKKTPDEASSEEERTEENNT